MIVVPSILLQGDCTLNFLLEFIGNGGPVPYSAIGSIGEGLHFTIFRFVVEMKRGRKTIGAYVVDLEGENRFSTDAAYYRFHAFYFRTHGFLVKIDDDVFF